MPRGVRFALISGALFAAIPMSPASAQQPVDADVLLTNATIYDGTGKAAFNGDVAIKGERIVAVGQFKTKDVLQTIDCTDLVVTPGFIDLHNHSDRQIIDSRTRANINYLTQGCTTIVTGNCGSGHVDVGEFYDKIDSAGAGTNVAHLLPQGSLREDVLGTVQRAPTEDEFARMKELAEKAMRDGAWGMSTGLIYVPSSYADADEITEIAKVVAAHGGIYASHIRNESVELLAAVNEAMQIGQNADLPVHVSHFKSSGRDSWGLVRRAADMIQKARDDGRKVTADQYPYIASSTSLDATLLPTWARSGGRNKLIERLDDDEKGKRIRDAIRRALKKREDGGTIRIARYKPRQDWVGKSLAAIAEDEHKSPLETAEHIIRSGGASIVNFSMSEDDVRHIMQIDWVATASDGRAYLPGADRPHPRSYGTFPRKIGHYSILEKVLPTARAVRSATGLPADILGMTDRGALKEGAFADVCVFDPKAFLDAATFDDPHQYSRGVEYVFVNGTPAVYRGHTTGALAGRALRHESTSGTPNDENEKR